MTDVEVSRMGFVSCGSRAAATACGPREEGGAGHSQDLATTKAKILCCWTSRADSSPVQSELDSSILHGMAL